MRIYAMNGKLEWAACLSQIHVTYLTHKGSATCIVRVCIHTVCAHVRALCVMIKLNSGFTLAKSPPRAS